MLSGLRADLKDTNWTRSEATELGQAVGAAAVRY